MFKESEELLGKLKDLKKLNVNLQEKESKHENIGDQLDKKEADRNLIDQQLSDLLGKPLNKVIIGAKRSIRPVLFLAIIIILAPVTVRTFGYFQVAAKVEKLKPVTLVYGNGTSNVDISDPQKNQLVTVNKGEKLFVRSDWIVERTGESKPSSRLVLDWRMPITSYASGLAHLYVFQGKKKQEESLSIVVGSKDDPSDYLVMVQLHNHPGFVVKPSHVVGISGNLKLKKKWCIKKRSSWVIGQFRHLMFAGSGRLIIKGYGGLNSTLVEGNVARTDEAHLIAFDGQLSYAPSRKETAFGAIFRKLPIVDIVFSGSGVLIRQNSLPPREKGNFSNKFDALLSGVGKVFGF